MAIHIRRREFIAALGGAMSAWPLPAGAEQISTAVIGLLDEGSAGSRAHFMEAFRSGLATGDYIEGRNLALEFRYADGELRRLPELARDLVHQQIMLIAAFGNAAALAAKAATTNLPIVFASSSDPVAPSCYERAKRDGFAPCVARRRLGPVPVLRRGEELETNSLDVAAANRRFSLAAQV
jgi:putative ABC transport system substrate-binding protein